MIRKPRSHLTYEERCQIYALKSSGMSGRAIARQINVSHVTISKELRRNNSLRGYRYKKAHELSGQRRKAASSKPKKLIPSTIALIRHMLKSVQASPEQIAGALAKNYKIQISPEAIYRYIYTDKACGGSLYLHLRRRSKKYNKRGKNSSGRGLIPNRVDIDQRPIIVEKKQRIGDFEVDTLVGANHQSGIVSIVDRASKYVFLQLVPRISASCIQQAVCSALAPLVPRKALYTLTSDNGKEFACHEAISKELGVDFYFAKPYQAWQRGLNEHTNGLVRQYLPKGSDFSKLCQKELECIQTKLNYRPRKILNFKTPSQIFLQSSSLSFTGNFRT